MRKLIFPVISIFLIASCGKNYDSMTIDEVFNKTTVAEQKEIEQYLATRLTQQGAMALGMAAIKCSKAFGERKLPEFCNQTLGKFIEQYAK